jgi:hypothetical protein
MVPVRGSALALAVVVVLVVVPAFAAARTAGGDRAAPAAGLPGSHPCPGSVVPGPYSGAVGIDGGPLGASATEGVELAVSYEVNVEIVNASTGTVEEASCLASDGATATNGSGAFSFDPALPTDSCSTGGSGSVCTDYSGPYGPVAVGLAGPPPAGYLLSSAATPPTFALTLVWELAAVTITPAGPTVTTSVGAPSTFSAEGWMANGSRTPSSPTYAWELNGTGWELVGADDGATVSLLALAGAGVGTLTLRATAELDGTLVEPPAVSVTLVAVATQIERGELNRTVLDAGGTVGVTLVALGADGLPYTAEISPGLGLPAVAAACAESPEGSGDVELSCGANLTYPETGTAQPTANITNGFSAASWTFPDVTIDPPPLVGVVPAEPVGYAGVATPFSVEVAAGSGAPPYVGACVAIAGDAPTCSWTPGPSWSFSPILPTPGSYDALAWAVDGAGANGSLAFSLRVVPPIELDPIALPTTNETAGTEIALSANLSGGDLPVRFWWNASDAAGPLATGTVDADGPLAVALTPAVSGAVLVSLTVVDGLGTVQEVSGLLEVQPAPATRLVLATAPPSTPVTVGDPVTVTWEAIDAAGGLDPSFAAAAEVRVAGPAGAAPWVNASGVGPLPDLGGGSYGVPASAWIGGLLELTVVETVAGPFTVSLAGASLPGSPPSAGGASVADRDQVALYDPSVLVAGLRTNATFWLVRDRFGNPDPGAILEIEFASGLATSETFLAAQPLPNGSSGLWLNFTAPDAQGGTLTVLDAAGIAVLGPRAIPAAAVAAAPVPEATALVAVAPLGAAAVAIATGVRRRSRARGEAAARDHELRRLAEGRQATLDVVRRLGQADLGSIEAAWDPPPSPPELADWLASLVGDGSLGAAVGDDGVARFCLAPRSDPASPRVTVDPEDLERALRRRDEELDPDQDGSRPTRS